MFKRPCFLLSSNWTNLNRYSGFSYTGRPEDTNPRIPDKSHTPLYTHTPNHRIHDKMSSVQVKILAYRTFCPVNGDLVCGDSVYNTFLSNIRGSYAGVVRCTSKLFCDSYTGCPLYADPPYLSDLLSSFAKQLERDLEKQNFGGDNSYSAKTQPTKCFYLEFKISKCKRTLFYVQI